MKGKIIVAIIGIAIIGFLAFSQGLITGFEGDYPRLKAVFEKHGLEEGVFTPAIDEQGFKQELNELKREFSQRVIRTEESKAVIALIEARLELNEAVNAFEKARSIIASNTALQECSKAVRQVETAISEIESSLSKQETAIARIGERMPENEKELIELEKSLLNSWQKTRQELKEVC